MRRDRALFSITTKPADSFLLNFLMLPNKSRHRNPSNLCCPRRTNLRTERKGPRSFKRKTKMRRLLGRRVAAILLVGVALLLLVLLLPGVWSRLVNRKPADDRPEGFREQALAASLTFRMHFLPGEQGERFKINLY